MTDDWIFLALSLLLVWCLMWWGVRVRSKAGGALIGVLVLAVLMNMLFSHVGWTHRAEGPAYRTHLCLPGSWTVTLAYDQLSWQAFTHTWGPEYFRASAYVVSWPGGMVGLLHVDADTEEPICNKGDT